MMKMSQLFTRYLFERKSNIRNRRIRGYSLVENSSVVSIYKRAFLSWKLSGVYGNVATSFNAETGSDKLRIYEHWLVSERYSLVKINKESFPGLLPNSKISDCFVLPYMRNVDGHTLVRSTRVVVITNKGQIYHNNPNRSTICDGESQYGDSRRFEESAIWDLPGRKYPSMADQPDSSEFYYPYLPPEAYEYHPAENSAEKSDRYGNAGFSKSYRYVENGVDCELSRFYIPQRDKEQGNPFYHIGGIEADYKMSLMGTYRSNTSTGVRTCIFASDDGGRNWFCKYEFGDSGEYEFNQSYEEAGHNWGNSIILKEDEEYPINSMKCCKRTVVFPTAACKEPSDIFLWDDSISICGISCSNTMRLTVSQPHGYKTGNVIVLMANDKNKSAYSYLCNNEINRQSAGNGLLYKVKVIDEFSFEIYEFTGNPFNNICCRHIHQINRIKDGWLIGTGEVYPGGWLFYFQMKEADTFSVRRAYSQFNIYRLNSTENSVQRTLGAVFLDDTDQTLIFASDHDLLERNNIDIPENRTLKISRNSTGIYKGKIKDIDDYTQFEILKETVEPTFFFKRINGVYYWCGQRGEFMLSKDLKEWYETRLDKPIISYGGTSRNISFMDDYIVVNKG